MELNDDLLEQISGGVEIGDVVNIRSDRIEYCAGCGYRSSVIETAIV